MNYIHRHWLGRQALWWTFWVNVVALRIVILYFERFTHPPFTERSDTAMALTVIYFTVFQLLVFPWQARGLIKACDNYLSALGSYLTVLLAQLGLGISLVVTVVYVAGAFQSLFADPAAMQVNQRLKMRSPLAGYTLRVGDDGTRIYLKGDFRIGLTGDLAALLERHPGVATIVLSSDGGRVAEGRGLARLIAEKGLNTYVAETCKSACTTAFIGGVTRTLGANGRLGFHQFSLDGMYNNPYIDPKAEQRVDLDFYATQKIDGEFLKKVFQAPPTDIWFPGPEELLAAGVVHRVED